MSKGEQQKRRPKSQVRFYDSSSVKLFPPKGWRLGRMALRPGNKGFKEILLAKDERPMDPPPIRNTIIGSVIVFTGIVIQIVLSGVLIKQANFAVFHQ